MGGASEGDAVQVDVSFAFTSLLEALAIVD